MKTFLIGHDPENPDQKVEVVVVHDTPIEETVLERFADDVEELTAAVLDLDGAASVAISGWNILGEEDQ